MKSLPVTVKGIAQELLNQYGPTWQDRIRKACSVLAQEDGVKYLYHTASHEPVYRVLSSSGRRYYTVLAGSCSCEARGLCYHRTARGILTILAANRTAVDFCEAVAAEEEPPTPPSTPRGEPIPAALNQCGEHPVYVAPAKPAKHVQSVGASSKEGTVRRSMGALGKVIAEQWTGKLFTLPA